MVYFLILQAENSSPAYCQFAVSHLLQTHSLNNDPTDRKTQVWGCEFEPDPEREGKERMFFPDVIVNSPHKLLHILVNYCSCKNLVLDQDNNFHLIHLSILITLLLDSGWILWEEVTFESVLGV